VNKDLALHGGQASSANNPKEVANANKFLDAVNEGITDVLAEKTLWLRVSG
jgi:hypothetical protein